MWPALLQQFPKLLKGLAWVWVFYRPLCNHILVLKVLMVQTEWTHGHPWLCQRLPDFCLFIVGQHLVTDLTQRDKKQDCLKDKHVFSCMKDQPGFIPKSTFWVAKEGSCVLWKTTLCRSSWCLWHETLLIAIVPKEFPSDLIILYTFSHTDPRENAVHMDFYISKFTFTNQERRY